MTVSRHCDVVIVGGGPAGSSCAWQLHRHGRDVTVLDKAQFPRDKVCAGWITPQVVSSLQIDLQEYGAGHVLQPINGFRVGMISRRHVDVNYDSIVSYGIRRCEFDHFLLRRSGARVREGLALRSLERTAAGWVINNSMTAEMLVAAGGQFCPVLHWLRTHDAAFSDAVTADAVVVAQEVEFPMTPGEQRNCAVDPQRPELYFYPDLRGYAWCIRKGRFLNIGLGRLGEQHLTAHRERFLKWLVSAGRIDGIPNQRFKGHAYRLNMGPQRACTSDRLLLIGDAAGLAAARSGEGIRPAVESGLIAADVLVEADQSLDRESLQPYADRLVQRLGTEPGSAGLMNGTVPAIRRLLSGWLLSNHRFVRQWVIDDWFLNRRRPAYQPTQPSPPVKTT